MLYFAYGSNLEWAQMKQRCPLAKFVCRAKLPAHRLAFTLKSVRRDCGVADVLPDQTKDVWGVVYELPDGELKNLDKKEGYRPGRRYEQNQYSRKDQYVWPEGDAERSLLVALYLGHPQLDPPLPSDDYKRLIVVGAKHWNLPAEYIRQLESIRTEL
jgi:gamma-glutamylcyclotransferase (GGCT)/AIG2-like uncharacterized protein YtfP